MCSHFFFFFFVTRATVECYLIQDDLLNGTVWQQVLFLHLLLSLGLSWHQQNSVLQTRSNISIGACFETEATCSNAIDSILNEMNSSTDYLMTLVMSSSTITNIYSSNFSNKWKCMEKSKRNIWMFVALALIDSFLSLLSVWIVRFSTVGWLRHKWKILIHSLVKINRNGIFFWTINYSWIQ